MINSVNIAQKIAVGTSGGAIGWFCAEFAPAFPLIGVATAFILCDVVSAFRLGRRVKKKYPKSAKRQESKFASHKFGKVVETIIQSYSAILLCYAAEHWVTGSMMDIPLAKIAAGIIIAWQGWSVLENEMSCTDKDGRLAKVLHRVLIDKTERHLNISLDELRTEEEKRKKNEDK